MAGSIGATPPVVEWAMVVTSVSRYTRRRLLEWAAIDPARVKVLPNTVDPRYQPGSKPGYLIARHATGGRKVLMTVSRLAASEQQKGQDRVIRILRRVLLEHPGAIYLIVGDGDDRPRRGTGKPPPSEEKSFTLPGRNWLL